MSNNNSSNSNIKNEINIKKSSYKQTCKTKKNKDKYKQSTLTQICDQDRAKKFSIIKIY